MRLKKNILKYLSFVMVFYSNANISQVNPDEYLNAFEIIEKGTKSYQDEEYDKAFVTFQKVNYNDTAYFDSRNKAIQCASIQKKYDTVISLCKEVLAVRKYNPNKERYINSIGHALLQQDKHQEALDYITEALKEFPRSYLLRYNRSTALYELDKYSDAVEELQMSIRYNPKYYASHLKLGAICAEAGDLTKASLSMNMALFLIASEKKAINLITALEAIYSGELGKELKKVNYRENEEFDEIDLMLKNQLAKNSKYKVKVKLQYDFIKTNHLLFETIQYDPNSNGFWNQNYVKFFKAIYDKGEFANFSYFESLSIDKPQTQSIILKNTSKISAFITWSSDKLTKCMNERKVWDGKKYETNILNHLGSYGFKEEVLIENDKMKGPYLSYGKEGLVKSRGQLTEEGEVDGIWKYYDEEGRLTTEANFVKGKLEGMRTTYYSNGSKQKEFDIKDNKINGNILTYYSFNQLFSKIPFNDAGNEHGDAEYYHKKGGVSHKMTFSDGKLNGDYMEYYSDGQLKAKFSYVNGDKDGDYISYHENGKVNIEGKYEKGETVGHWKYTHDNGQLKEEGDLKAGFRTGIWQTFNQNGKLAEETNYGETGKKTGVYKEYNLDGLLVLELTYKGEEIISYITYNDKGEVVSKKEKQKKELEFVDYYDNGKLRIQGNYYKGKHIGIWKRYNQYGVLTSENSYNEDGNLNGLSKWYFDNGQIETIKNFKDGAADGYYVDYYRNGNIFKHGWIKDDKSVGEWVYFYRNGTINNTRYFLEGEVHGDIVYYDEKGRLNEIAQYFYGNFEGIITYDTLGNEIGNYPLKDGASVSEYKDANGKLITTKIYKGVEVNGEQIAYFANGKIKSKGTIIDGDYSGAWKWYDRKGYLSSEGNYVLGRKEGAWKWYYENGKIRVIENFVNGNLEGALLRYYENGNKESEKSYRNNERHGESIYYDESEEVQYIRYYADGLMLGYSYLGKDGKPVAMIPFGNQNGSIEAFFSSGLKSYYAEYKDGFNQGKSIYYHSNGKEADMRISEKGQFHGKLFEYYKDGKIKAEDDYVNGDQYGESKEYYKNGKLKSVEHYILGELYGWAEYYNENGSISEKVFYYNGRQLN